MRYLPHNKSPKQKTIIDVCFDYYGPDISPEETKSAKKLSLWLMNRRKGISLTDEEKSDLWAIRENIKDLVYLATFLTD